MFKAIALAGLALLVWSAFLIDPDHGVFLNTPQIYWGAGLLLVGCVTDLIVRGKF